MKRKFKLRIIQKNYKYYLQYAYYFLWPDWSFINQFYPEVRSLGPKIKAHYGKLEYTSPSVVEVESTRFNTIEKVLTHIKTELGRYQLWEKEESAKNLYTKINEKGFIYKEII